MPTILPIEPYILPSYSARYTFSGKERDEETGFSYFGARYYNSSYSIWLSVDPMSDKYPSISPYAYCGNNPIKLVDPSGEEVADDIIIHGKNNSSITIKTDLVDWNINANVDFGGNYELESDRVAIGYEYGIDASGRAGAGTSYTAYKQSVMFLGGPYSGYWYDYLGGEAQIDVSASAEGTIGVHKNFFIASTSDPKIYNPENFAGAYYGASLSGSWKAIGGLSLDAQCAISKDKSWKAISFGVSGSIGPQIGFFAGFSGSIGGHFGKSHLVGDIKPTKQRSSYDIGMNWLSHLFF